MAALAPNESYWGGNARADDSDTKTRVFISYSSGTDEFGDPFREMLANKLDAMGFHVLIDERLQAGDRWRTKLLRWACSCEVAIILLTPPVLDKKAWVRFEAQLLGLRWETDDLSLLIPVLLPGFEQDDLERMDLSTKGPVPIDAAQVASLEPAEQQAADGKDLLLARVVDAVKKVKTSRAAIPGATSGPMRAWIQRVASQLRGNEFLADAAEQLGITADEAPASQELLEEFVAYKLLHSDITKIELAIDELELSDAKRKKLAAMVVPSWLSADAVRFLAKGCRADRGERVAALSVEADDTAADFVKRVTYCASRAEPVEAITANGAGEDANLGILNRYRDKICTRLGASPALGTADIESGEADLEAMGKSVFVLLGQDALKEGVAEPLMDEFKGSVFVLNGEGDDFDANVLARIKYRCTTVVDRDQERRVRRAARRLQQ